MSMWWKIAAAVLVSLWKCFWPYWFFERPLGTPQQFVDYTLRTHNICLDTYMCIQMSVLAALSLLFIEYSCFSLLVSAVQQCGSMPFCIHMPPSWVSSPPAAHPVGHHRSSPLAGCLPVVGHGRFRACSLFLPPSFNRRKLKLEFSPMIVWMCHTNLDNYRFCSYLWYTDMKTCLRFIFKIKKQMLHSSMFSQIPSVFK